MFNIDLDKLPFVSSLKKLKTGWVVFCQVFPLLFSDLPNICQHALKNYAPFFVIETKDDRIIFFMKMSKGKTDTKDLDSKSITTMEEFAEFLSEIAAAMEGKIV